jgi:formiminotetrahydrofolate cyclodeaminase
MEGSVSKLVQLSVRDLVQELSSGNPTPGGGSVAALCGALGAALSTMVSRLTLGREKFKDAWESMEEVRQGADKLSERFLNLVQEDSDVYQQVMAALRLPKETEDHKSSQRAALQKALKRAAMVPLRTLRASEQLIYIAKEAVERGNPNALTDAGTAAYLARTAATVASYNVRINLSGIKDEAFVAKCKKEVEETLERMKTLFADANGYMNAHLA